MSCMKPVAGAVWGQKSSLHTEKITETLPLILSLLQEPINTTHAKSYVPVQENYC